MQIVLFHLMPYADLDLEAGRRNATVWVNLPNRMSALKTLWLDAQALLLLVRRFHLVDRHRVARREGLLDSRI